MADYEAPQIQIIGDVARDTKLDDGSLIVN